MADIFGVAINWEMFGAGIALIGFTIMLLIINGLLASFKIKVMIPWYISGAIFIVGLLLVMESVGLITGVNEALTYAVKSSNIPELILGFVVVFISVYKPIYDRIGVTPSGWLRLGIFVFGVILILDAIRILPIYYYLSQLIGYALQNAILFLAEYPWVGIVIVLAVFILITVLYLKLTRRGGVTA